MPTTEIITTLDWIQRAGTISGLLLILVGGARGVWCWGYQLREVKAECAAQLKEAKTDRDYYRTMAYRLLHVAERVVPTLPEG